MFTNLPSRIVAFSLLSIVMLPGTAAMSEPLRLSAVMTNPDGVRFQVLRFSDLNPASPAGTEALYRRIKRSAELVCQVSPVTRPVFRADIERCRRSAVARAIAEIGSDALNARHRMQPRRASRG